jgi:septal ring factor EnvC (AmiA/AmiB activator)
MMWLLKGLAPDHNTIANFRKDNPEPIRKVFRATVEIAKHFELIGGKLVAGDSTNMRAQNSKKNNFNQKKLAEKLAYIEARLKEYTAALAQEDGDTTELQAKIAEQEKRKAQYEQIQQHWSNRVKYNILEPILIAAS